MREFYPPIEPYNQGHLKVSNIHSMYYEESGNPKGFPAVFVHGGPGGGTQADHRRYFDPKYYRIILFDQRGCGKSTPNASLEENTTWDLVSDMEKLREHLGIEKWLVFGGRGVRRFHLHTQRPIPNELRTLFFVESFSFESGKLIGSIRKARTPFSRDRREDYIKPIPEVERGDFVSAFYKRLTSKDRKVQVEAARAWSAWEGSTSKLLVDPDMVAHYSDDDFAIAFARIECHYFVNKGFMEDGQLLRDVGRIRHIPTVIVQGRYDVVCPIRSAWDLHRAFPEAKLVITPMSGRFGLRAGEPFCSH